MRNSERQLIKRRENTSGGMQSGLARNGSGVNGGGAGSRDCLNATDDN